MWKVVVGFVLFAALSLLVIMTVGERGDSGAEKHGADAVHDQKPETPDRSVPADAASAASRAR